MVTASTAAISSDLASSPRCPNPPQRPTDRGKAALHHRIYNVSAEPRLRILYKEDFRAFEHEAPFSLLPSRELCRWLAPQQWPYCKFPGQSKLHAQSPSITTLERATQAVASATAADYHRPHHRRQTNRHNTLMLVSMPCAFTDAGRNFRGALYDGSRILNAQHRSATPRFGLGPLRRYAVAAVGLTPYGHLADAHFYASTAPWVLTLLHLLPAHVPILVASSSRLAALYAQLGVPADRLHTLPPNDGVAYADRLLSLVTTPFGCLEPLGARALRRVRARLVPLAPPVSSHGQTRVILLSRQSQRPRRSLRNQPQLLDALRQVVARSPPHSLVVFEGSHSAAQPLNGGTPERGRPGETSAAVLPTAHSSHRRSPATLADTARYFSTAAVLTGSHGGAFLNAIFCPVGTPVVEIGYTGQAPMAYPSYYHTMSRRLGLPFWVVLGSGGYDRPVTAPVGEVAALIEALIRGNRTASAVPPFRTVTLRLRM